MKTTTYTNGKFLVLALIAGFLFCSTSSYAGSPDKTKPIRTTENLAYNLEEEMNIESWMFDTDYFAVPMPITEDLEEELELENWMQNTDYFTEIQSVREHELELESWMSDVKFWQTTPTL